ncbi:hypothetical protein HUU42_06960 [bacterium]|nr:hypothetical protein [bacterium]
MLFSFSVQAKVWTVSQTPGANFTTLSAAHAAAASGDTILVAGTPSVAYPGFTFTKKLYVFGPGFFLSQNTGLQADTNSAKIGACSFNSGSSGTVVMGMHFIGSININTNNITLKRIRLELTSGFVNGIVIANNLNDITITQSFLTLHSGGAVLISLGTLDSNIIIKNNFIEGLPTSYRTIDGSSAFTGSISNNIIYAGHSTVGVDIDSPVFNNNIIRNGGINLNGSVTPYNNLCNGTQLAAINGNQQNVNMTSVFVSSGTSDGKWKIAEPGGPADGAGFGGVDCGMFDTSENNAYVLSGVPPMPSIYEFTANSDLSNVTVKAKSNN